MRFKLGLLLGGIIGYVLGARAGRERYQQIRRWAGGLRKHPAVAQLVDQGTGLLDASRYLAAAGLTAGARGLRAVENGDSG